LPSRSSEHSEERRLGWPTGFEPVQWFLNFHKKTQYIQENQPLFELYQKHVDETRWIKNTRKLTLNDIKPFSHSPLCLP
jgi:hypothetical protein